LRPTPPLLPSTTLFRSRDLTRERDIVAALDERQPLRANPDDDPIDRGLRRPQLGRARERDLEPGTARRLALAGLREIRGEEVHRSEEHTSELQSLTNLV